MQIGKRIKTLREKLSISQTELAKRSHSSKQTIYKYENGIITNIPSEKIELIAKILNTTPGYLMGWEETTNKNYSVIETKDGKMVEVSNQISLSDKEERILAFFRLFNKRGQERALESLEELSMISLYTENEE